MVTSNKSNLKEEERLVEEVQKSLCLYDKSNKSYKEKKPEKSISLGLENAFGYDECT